MPKSERRRYSRLNCDTPALLCWTDEHGKEKYARGKCVNISEFGCCLELTELVPLRTRTSLRIAKLGLSAAASVRYVVRRGMKFVVGMEFNQPFRNINAAEPALSVHSDQ